MRAIQAEGGELCAGLHHARLKERRALCIPATRPNTRAAVGAVGAQCAVSELGPRATVVAHPTPLVGAGVRAERHGQGANRLALCARANRLALCARPMSVVRKLSHLSLFQSYSEFGPAPRHRMTPSVALSRTP